jgi:tryptophan synthase alpha chain
MNRIDKLFSEKKDNILSVYFTAGYPQLDSTVEIIRALADAGADVIEIGIPFSDPMADGPVIQRSNEKALRNGMNLKLLFSQLRNIRNEVRVPILLMGYLNPVMQFGIEEFCIKCMETGIDGVILPDLPPSVYSTEFLPVFNKYKLYNILLISPRSTAERIQAIDKISQGFIYMVSSSSVTGRKGGFSDDQIAYFKRVGELKLQNPRLIGFGISNRGAFVSASKNASGGIIGSAFIDILDKDGDMIENIHSFISEIIR